MSPVRLGILVTPWASLPLHPLPCLLTLSLGSAVNAGIPPTFPLVVMLSLRASRLLSLCELSHSSYSTSTSISSSSSSSSTLSGSSGSG